MKVWINDYVDLSGKDVGQLLILAPNLHIVLAGDRSDYKARHSIGITCSRCRKIIGGRNVFPVPQDTRVLSCDCLTVVFGAEAFPADWIIEHWDEWSRIRRDAQAQLAAGSN